MFDLMDRRSMVNSTFPSWRLPLGLLIIATTAQPILSIPDVANVTTKITYFQNHNGLNKTSMDSTHMKLMHRSDKPNSNHEISTNIESSTNPMISPQYRHQPTKVNRIQNSKSTSAVKDTYLDALDYSQTIKKYDSNMQKLTRRDYTPSPVYRPEESINSVNKNEPKISRVSYSGSSSVSSNTFLPPNKDSHYENQNKPQVSFGPFYSSDNFYESSDKNYGTISQASYGPPLQTSYGPPSNSYEPPSNNYGPPKDTYGPPKDTYGPPKDIYGPPKDTYGPPKDTYGPPKDTYGPPKDAYGPPKDTYGPPSNIYGPVSHSYGPPATDYGSAYGSSSSYVPYGPSGQGLGSIQATYSTSHPLPDIFPLALFPAVDFSWPISLKINAYTLIKIILKIVIFKMIVKFIATICLLLFLPKIIHKKDEQNEDDESREFNDSSNFSSERLHLLSSIVTRSIEHYGDMNKKNGTKTEAHCTGFGCQISRSLFASNDTWEDYIRLFKSYVAEEQDSQEQSTKSQSKRK